MSLRKNTLWNLAGSGLPLLAAAALIPYMLNVMGNELFGILTLIWALIGYFSLFDLGIGRSLTYEISQLKANGLHTEIAHTLKAGMLLTFATGILGAVMLWFMSPLLVKWLKVSVTFQADAILAFKFCALAIIPTTVTSGLRGALEGFERFAASNLSKLIVGFSMFALPALTIRLHGASLSSIAAYLCVMRIMVALFVVWQMRVYFQNTGSKLSKHYFNKLFNYGFWVTITGIVGPLMVYGDRFFVSAIIGASQLPFYAIPQEGLFRLLIIPSAFCAALLPKLAALNGLEAINLYHRNYRRMTVVMFAICLVAAMLAYPALYFWLSPDFAKKSLSIILILVVGVFLNGISLVPYTFLHAKGKPKVTAIFHVIELCVYIPVLWILTQHFGLAGAALAWVGRVLLDYVLLQITANKIIKTYYAKI